MNRERVLVDTGPLVAVLSNADKHHDLCVNELANLRPPLLTCWPVVTEILWLLRQDERAVAGLFRAFEAHLLALFPLGEDALAPLQAFLRRYRKIGAQLADAALVYLAEREGITTVFTLDQRAFTVYRYHKNKSLNLVPAPGAYVP